MHRHTAGLVNHQQRIILKHHIKLPRRNVFQAANSVFRLRHANRRNPHHIARRHTTIRLGTPLVYAHFAAANNAVDMAFGNAF